MSDFDRNLLEPLSLANVTSNNLFTAYHKNKKYLVKTYIGKDKESHQKTEKNRLSFWAEQGFHVPKLNSFSVNFPPNTPYLVLEFIEGRTLMEHLKDSKLSLDKKLGLLTSIFKENAKRHRVTIQTKDQRLIHHDLNTGNILIRGDFTFYYIDFEDSFAQNNNIHKIEENISIEVAKLIRWSARDLGSKQLTLVLECMLEAYAKTPIPTIILNRIINRPLQFIHRWKDNKKKIRLANDVTKYDIADALQIMLPIQPSRI